MFARTCFAAGDRGDDYGGLDVWSRLKKGDVLQSGWETKKVLLRGDAILLEKSESAAFAIYSNGKRFAFFQVSD